MINRVFIQYFEFLDNTFSNIDFSMVEWLSFPKSHLVFARILKDNNNCILTSLNYF